MYSPGWIGISSHPSAGRGCAELKWATVCMWGSRLMTRVQQPEARSAIRVSTATRSATSSRRELAMTAWVFQRGPVVIKTGRTMGRSSSSPHSTCHSADAGPPRRRLHPTQVRKAPRTTR